MRSIVLFLFSLISIAGVFAQEKLEYSFDQARVLLAQRKIDEAIISLRHVYVSEPNNANINFLMGAAYTELPGAQDEALFHLKKAVQNVGKNYKVGDFREKKAPIHVYYYLAVALVEQDKCAEANEAFTEFKKYGDKVDKYFIDEVDRHLQKCPFGVEEKVDNWNKEEEAPLSYDPTYIAPEEVIEPDTASLNKKGLVTEKLEYTTSAPLYGVQIGSNKNPALTSSFGNVKNVDVFIDNEGMIRYVVGHFSYERQAENLLKVLKEKGFSDAFIVNVNDERKYSNEVISYQNVNLRSGIKGNVEFLVQLGSFKDSIPENLAKLYLQINGISEHKQNGRTVLATGPFKAYKDALNEKDKVTNIGIQDAFIVAYNKGKKVPLDEAIKYSEGQPNK